MQDMVNKEEPALILWPCLCFAAFGAQVNDRTPKLPWDIKG